MRKKRLRKMRYSLLIAAVLLTGGTIAYTDYQLSRDVPGYAELWG